LGASPDWVLHYDKHVDELTAADIQKIAGEVTRENKSFTAVLLPEEP
jgi:hypothetical protein